MHAFTPAAIARASSIGTPTDHLGPGSPGAADTGLWLLLIGAIVISFIAIAVLLLVLSRVMRAGRVSDQVARAQHEADLQFRSIANTANLVLANYDERGRLAYVSPGIRRLTGISAAQFVAGNATLEDVAHPDDRASLDKAREAREQGDQGDLEFDYRLKDKRGRWHWLHVRQSPVINDEELRGHNTVAVDFTDRVLFDQQQRRLLHLQQLSTTIVESFLATSDTTGTTESILDMVCRYFDLSAACIFEREEDVDPFERTHFWRNSRLKGHETAAQPEAAESLDADKTAWWMDRLRTGSPLSFNPDQCSPEDVIALRELTGTAAFAVLVVPVLVLGGLRLMIVLEDLEERREWQPEELAAIQTMAHAIARSLERSSAETERSEFEETRRGHERSEIIAHLASGIAHDFNNIVFAVSGRIQLLRRRTEDEQTRASLDEIQKTLQGAKGIIGALLAMHRGTGPREGSIRIGPEIRAVATMIRRLIPKRIRFDVEIRLPDTVQAQVTAEALHQILMNLVVNARDAVESGGRIMVTLDESDDEEVGIAMHIDDDGPGIPDDQRAEVFKPFVTTKDASRGTGLGLSIVQRVAREHGGKISLEDSPLGGLRATASFREVEADQRSMAVLPDAASAADTDLARVLIIEDDTMIRDVLVRAFESIGIEVIHRGDALEVNTLLSENGKMIDVVIMDIDLPQKTGLECLHEIRTAGVDTPCVLITGGLTEAPANIRHVRLLRKPFPIETLEATCRALVAEHRSSSE